MYLLFGTGQDTRGVDERQFPEQLGLHLGVLQAVQETSAELLQRRERFVCLPSKTQRYNRINTGTVEANSIIHYN